LNNDNIQLQELVTENGNGAKEGGNQEKRDLQRRCNYNNKGKIRIEKVTTSERKKR